MIENNGRPVRLGYAIAVALAVASLGSAAQAQSGKVDTVINEQLRAEQAAQQSQKRVAQIDDETTAMLSEYRQAVAQAQSLKSYTEQLSATVRSQRDEIETKIREITEIETTAREVLPMMNRMLATLEEFVRLDVPFLPDERSRRIESLKEMMNAADVSISEKYRRIVEAYQIETEYGRTLESYSGKIGERTVDFLRVGRVALLYQTLDGKETGYWNKDAKEWTVDNEYRESVKDGIKIARKQAAPDFLVVPVAAPQEAK